MSKEAITQLEVRSPITGGADVSLLREVECGALAADYLRIFGVDINALLKGRQKLGLYRCNESGFRFYAPPDVVGDGSFYRQLESNDWYYMPTKWEFQEAIRFIRPGSSVLEIGAARGDFLLRLREQVPDVMSVGLELNAQAAETARTRGVPVRVESSSEHAVSHPAAYDAVVSFQLLEHVPNPMDILKDALSMLKPGGLVIVGVPDNSARPTDSIFVTQQNILNMPPHHQGLWDVPSLAFLQKVLPVRLEHVAVEPATATHHSNSYRGLMKSDLIARFGRFLGFALYALGRPFYNHALSHLNPYLPAHSILAVYRRLP